MTTRASRVLNESLSTYQMPADGVYKPGFATVTKLESAIYAIKSNMSGIFFEKKTLVQDSVMKFQDPRLAGILKEAEQFWGISDDFKKLGIIHKRGILLYGSPGVGKSVLMSQVAEDAIKKDAVVFYASDPRLASEALKQFREVEPTRRVVTVFDDVDNDISYGESSFLKLLDGENKIDHVLYIATTNYLERFPARLLRSGRFDSKLEVLAPPEEGRLAFFKAKVKGISKDVLEQTVQATEGFSFAQLREVLASVFAYKRDLQIEVDRIRTGEPVQTVRPSLYKTEGKIKQVLGMYENYTEDTIEDTMPESNQTQTRASRVLEKTGGEKMADQVQKKSKKKMSPEELAKLAKKFDAARKK